LEEVDLEAEVLAAFPEEAVDLEGVVLEDVFESKHSKD
jgi:hypothetical protein